MNRKVVEAVTDPRQRFLDFEVPVRHGKSFLLSGFLPVWHLGMFPDRPVFLLSYNEEKAAEWGEFTREILSTWGAELFNLRVDSRTNSKTHWKLKGHRGEVIATGLDGTITGKGGALVVIDDPIKNRAEADSAAVRRSLREGYYSNVRTRLATHGTVVLAMARWRWDDLAGEVVHGYGKERQPGEEVDLRGEDEWEVIRFPALAEAPDDISPEARAEWRDELGRAEGDALWPEMWPESILRGLEATYMANDPQTWDSLYQQRPAPRGGGEFQKDKWIIAPSVDRSAMVRMVRWWDLAATPDGGDWTVGALVGIDNRNTIYVLDVQRKRLRSADVEDLVRRVAAIDGVKVPIRIEQERAGAGKAQIDSYVRLLVGYDVDGKRPEGDKEQRAAPAAAQQQRGNIVLARGEWNKDWIEEHAQFPKGRHDDQVDCLSAAVEFLASRGPTAIETEWHGQTPLAQLYGNGQKGMTPGGSVIEQANARLLGSVS